MTTSAVNPSVGPANAVTGLGERHHDGAEKKPDTDFSGLLSLLSKKAGSDGGPRSAQAQPFVARTAASTVRVEVGRSSPAAAPAHGSEDDPRGTVDDVLQGDASEIPVVADGIIFSEESVVPPVRPEAESITRVNDVSADDMNPPSANEADGQATEIQALLSSVIHSTPPKAGEATSQLSAKTAPASATGSAMLASGARTKAGSETTGIMTQLGDEEQDTQLSGEMEWMEPAPAGLEKRASSTASSQVKEQSLTSALAGDVKVSVLQTETHHAPVLFGGPVAQILDGIRTELTADGEISLKGRPADPAAKLGNDAPVRVLLIQLQPADLGTVTVRMSLKEDALELHIEASQQETAQRLQQDQDMLLKVLRSAGYLVDGAAIRVTEAEKLVVSPGNAGSPGLGTPSQSSYQGSAGGTPSEGGTSQGRGQHEHAARGNPDRNSTAGADGEPRRSASGLYV